MTYVAPFVTSRFTAYRGSRAERTLSLAVRLIDAVTGQAPVGSFRVFLKERESLERSRQEPIRNLSGYYCFLNVPDGPYTIRVIPSASSTFYYLHVPGAAPPSMSLEAAVALPAPDFKDPSIELTLAPAPGYPFSVTTTLLRGRVLLNDVEASGAVVETTYRQAQPTEADPDATGMATVKTITTVKGEYALFLMAPSPSRQPRQVKATINAQNKQENVTIREGQTTEVADIKVP